MQLIADELGTQQTEMSVVLCVCVCEREREREATAMLFGRRNEVVVACQSITISLAALQISSLPPSASVIRSVPSVASEVM